MRPFELHDIEHMAKRFGPSRTGDPFLDSRYDWQKNDNGAEWPYYRFFYHLSKWLQPDLVVELGGYQGTAAAHFAAGWSKTIVTSIDHHTDSGDETNQHLMQLACLEYSNMRYIRGWTNPVAAEREKGNHSLGDAPNACDEVRAIMFNANRKIDILFIDSWHTYDNAVLDWQYYKPLLNSPALVICDDIQGGYGPAISGMLDFWNELPEPKFLNANLHPGTNMGFLKV